MANRYFINGGINNNWGDTSNWSDTSNGTGGFSVPTTSDNVFLDAFSPNCTLNSSNRVCDNLDCTGYTNTLTMGTFQLSMASGNTTFSPTMTITGTNTVGLSIGAGGTVTTNGYIVQVNMSFATSSTYTLADNLTTRAGIRCGATTFNGNTILLDDNSFFVIVSTNLTCIGTTNIKIIGNNVSLGADTASLNVSIGLNIEINNPGKTVTFRSGASGQFGFGAKTFKYVAGNVTWNATFIRLSQAGTVTFDMGSQTVPGVTTVVSGITISIVSNLYVTGTTTFAVGAVVNGGNLYCYGLTHSSATNTTGTSAIIFNGTGTWNHTSTGAIRNNLTINTAGTLTLGANIRYDTGTLTYTAGTVASTGNTFTIGANTILTTNGVTWNNITLGSSVTSLTLTNRLTATGILLLSTASVTFGGSEGFTVGQLKQDTNLTAARTITLLSTKEYIMTSNFIVIGATNTFRLSFVSSTPSVKAILTLEQNALQEVAYANATDIDSSEGQKIFSFDGVTSNTLNWDMLNISEAVSSGTTIIFFN